MILTVVNYDNSLGCEDSETSIHNMNLIGMGMMVALSKKNLVGHEFKKRSEKLALDIHNGLKSNKYVFVTSYNENSKNTNSNGLAIASINKEDKTIKIEDLSIVDELRLALFEQEVVKELKQYYGEDFKVITPNSLKYYKRKVIWEIHSDRG